MARPRAPLYSGAMDTAARHLDAVTRACRRIEAADAPPLAELAREGHSPQGSGDASA